jgi:YHS domain-containing protein
MKLFYLVILSLLFTTQILLAEEPVNVSYFGSTAIGGHDSKAYHALSRGDEARKGSKQFVVEWKGAKWQFLSAEDSQQFTASPEKYAPAYNGFCANALSLGEGLIKTNGKYWAIFDGQLYLFYAPRGAQRWFDGEYSEYKAEADKAWAGILQLKH